MTRIDRYPFESRLCSSTTPTVVFCDGEREDKGEDEGQRKVSGQSESECEGAGKGGCW